MKEGVNINSNNISQILDIADKNSTITDLKVEGNVLLVVLNLNLKTKLLGILIIKYFKMVISSILLLLVEDGNVPMKIVVIAIETALIS